MRVTYQADNYSPSDVCTRYVAMDPVTEEFTWIEVGTDRRYNIRRGTVDAHELPPAVQDEARRQSRYWPLYVAWPL